MYAFLLLTIFYVFRKGSVIVSVDLSAPPTTLTSAVSSAVTSYSTTDTAKTVVAQTSTDAGNVYALFVIYSVAI